MHKLKLFFVSFIIMTSAQLEEDLNALENLVQSQNDQNTNLNQDLNVLEDLVKLQEDNNENDDLNALENLVNSVNDQTANDDNDLNVLEDLGNILIELKSHFLFPTSRSQPKQNSIRLV